MAKQPNNDELSPLVGLMMELKRRLPGLWKLCRDDGQPALAVSLRRRGAGDWLAVVTREGDDGGPEVLFASGSDWVECLRAADGQVQAGRWRPDKPRKAVKAE